MENTTPTSPSENLTDEEYRALGDAIASILTLNQEGIPQPVLSDELKGILRDFWIGLTFPNAIDIGPVGSKRRKAFTVLSFTWHTMNSPVTIAVSNDRVRQSNFE